MNNNNNLIFINKEVKQLKSSKNISDLSYSQITRSYLQNEIIQDWLMRLEKNLQCDAEKFPVVGKQPLPHQYDFNCFVFFTR
jgi:hypothetical protein